MAVRNTLLAALPGAEQNRVLSHVDIVPLKLKAFVHKAGEQVKYVYFPGGGFLSVVTILEDGSMVEVATIGREGAVGIAAALDSTPTTSATLVQGATDACYRMGVGAFRHEMERRGAFYDLMTRYSHAYLAFIMQSTACNAVHSVEQRLARWLLMARDRMESDDYPLTQEFVAMMLGVNRSTVTLVAGALQRKGLITYRRGRVAILNRRALAAASCECYRTATKALNAVVARPAGIRKAR